MAAADLQFKNRKLKVGNMNVRGLNQMDKQTELNIMIEDQRLDILAITETWLDKCIEEKLHTHAYELSAPCKH